MALPSPDYDVAVLGGGPAGAACAIALAGLGIGRVVLCEAEETRPERLGETIPPDTRPLLDRLGVLEAFLAGGHAPCHGSCSSWGSDRLGHNDFLLSPFGPGWHLDRQRFEQMLLDQAVARGVTLRQGMRLSGARREADGHRLTFRAGQALRARLVVDATGSAGIFARMQGARRQEAEALHCVAARFSVRAPDLSRLTWLEAVPEGWWYAARLPGESLLVMFASDADLMRHRGLTDPERFGAALCETLHIHRLLKTATLTGTLRAWAAPSFLLDHSAGTDWIAIGDAASCYDPITSQGLYKALASGLSAAQAIAATLNGNATTLATCAASVRHDFETYQAMRRHLYGLERRWSEAAFWRRRQKSLLRAAATRDLRTPA